MKIEIKRSKYLPILIIVFAMLLLAAGAVSGVWYYMDRQSKSLMKEKALQIQDLQNQIKKLEENNNQDENTTPVNNNFSLVKTYEVKGSAYQNDEYGFKVTLNSSWQNVKVFENYYLYDYEFIGSTPKKIREEIWYIALPTKDNSWEESGVAKGYADKLAVSATPKDVWYAEKKESPDSLSVSGYLAENSKYVFSWGPPQSGPTDFVFSQKEVETVAKTLVAYEPK